MTLTPTRLSPRVLVTGVALLVLTGSVLFTQTAPAGAPVSDEYLLLGSPNRGAGEPIIFVNPKDSDNIIVVAMATLNRLPSGEVPLGRGGPGPAGPVASPAAPAARGGPAGPGAPAAGAGRTQLRIKELSTPDGSRTDIAVSRDGGKTWSSAKITSVRFSTRIAAAIPLRDPDRTDHSTWVVSPI